MRAPLLLLSLLCAIVVSSSPALAWPWKVEPQPVLNGREAMLSDDGSPLAWDQSARTLWHFFLGSLVRTYWARGTFNHAFADVEAQATGGLLVDPATHFLYFVNANGLPSVRRPGKMVVVETIGAETVTRLLAINPRRRAIFAYDAVAQGIRRYAFDAKTKTWSNALIATGLGRAEEAAAFNPLTETLYSSHQTADAGIARKAGGGTISDPTGIGAWAPWPLVATRWTGTAWVSEVLDETGVPQQPAVRLTDHCVFFARRDDGENVHFYQPARGKMPESFGVKTGWAGARTWEDTDTYPIRRPDYPGEWNTGGVITVWTNFVPEPTAALPGPITVVPFYTPVWSDTPLPKRLARFRAVVNPKQNRLVQHRVWSSGEVVRNQTGKQLAGYLYRGSNGVLARRGYSSQPGLFTNPSAALYPPLDASFDPANPPASFQNLAAANVPFFAFTRDTTLPTAASESTFRTLRSIPPEASTDAQAPYAAPHLRLPTTAEVETMGHNYGAKVSNQVGTRFRVYTGASTSLATGSTLAVDQVTGATFYPQARPPQTETASTWFPTVYGAAPLPGFSPAAERKFTPTRTSVWLVFVY